MILSSCHNIAEISLVILLLRQTLDTGHQNIIVTEEVIKEEPRQGVAETLVLVRIQNLDMNRNIQLLSGSWTQSKDCNLITKELLM